MKISDVIYKKILSISTADFETGGILGGTDRIITSFELDKNSGICERGVYIPNVDYLNSVISEWQKNGIEFYGIFHTHLNNNPTLSDDDKDNIIKIMLFMPKQTKELYFPVIIPKKDLYPYVAIRMNNEIHINLDKLCILKSEEV